MRDARPWTFAALFGSLWAAAEVTLGTVLKLAQVPMFGLIMASIAVACLVTARRLQPTAGVCLVMGVLAAALKLCSLGMVSIGPVIGILADAVLVEAAMLVAGTNLAGAVLGGGLAVASAPVQQAVWVTLVTGPRAVAALEALLRRAFGVFGLEGQPLPVLVAVLAALAAVAGAAAGAVSWRLAGRVRRRVWGTV